MAILSKELFDRNICAQTPCSIFHLWSDKCSDGIRVMFINSLLGAAKFFGPIYVLRIILNWKKISKKYVANEFVTYLRSIGYSAGFAVLYVGSICLFTNIKPTYYNAVASGAVAGLSILLETNENRNLDTLLFLNQVVEGTINLLTHHKCITRSRWNETLTFMCISSVLMYLFKTTCTPPKFIHLWFYPTKNILENQLEKAQYSCQHVTTCLDYAKNGAIKYFCAGYGFEFIRTTLPIISRLIAEPKSFVEKLFNKNNVLFGLFLGSYVYLYRTINCYLLRRNGKELPTHSSLAAFIAGTTYCFRPNIQILIIGATTVLQLICCKFQKKYSFTYNIPYSLIIFCILSSMLFHLRIHLEDCCPSYTRNMLNTITNGVFNKIIKNAWTIINESEKHLAA